MGILSACGPNPSPFRYGLRPERLEDRQVLVTFEDRTLGRTVLASPVDVYRVRPLYTGQGWRTRRAEALAMRHRLQLVTLWPLAALGVTCGVFWVPPERSLPEVLDAVRQDPGVEQVQPLQRFRPLRWEPPARGTQGEHALNGAELRNRPIASPGDPQGG